jgi:hypothetical protein
MRAAMTPAQLRTLAEILEGDHSCHDDMAAANALRAAADRIEWS